MFQTQTQEKSFMNVKKLFRLISVTVAQNQHCKKK